MADLGFEKLLAEREAEKLKHPIITTPQIISDEMKNLIEDLNSNSIHDGFNGGEQLWEK